MEIIKFILAVWLFVIALFVAMLPLFGLLWFTTTFFK